MFLNVNGLWGLIVLVADVWAIVNIFKAAPVPIRKSCGL